MIIILLLCLCLGISNNKVDGSMPSISKDEDLDLERQLKLINKSPVQTIQTEFGYIVDCIDINKQPAFDHPLLKNHKLQRKPSFQGTTAKVKVHDRSARPSKIGVRKNLCPRGTVPIKRTTKDDLIRAKRLSNITGLLTQDMPGIHYAQVILRPVRYSSYYGVSGITSVYNPTVTDQQQSSAYIWLQNGLEDAFNEVYTGWQVYPDLYRDDNTHFFTFWVDQSTSTGCYDMQCPGFVQVDKTIYPGLLVSNTSTYAGDQYEMGVSLSQDPNTKNWWVRAQDADIGYFPAVLFSNLGSAARGGWSGRTTSPPGSPSPPMGSGHLPDDDNYLHACYFRQIAVKNESRKDFGPSSSGVYTFADNPSCYDAKYYGRRPEQDMGYCLLLGGPGGNCGN